jgi:hypothetical protein
MDIQSRFQTSFDDLSYAIEEAYFLANRDKTRYSIVQTSGAMKRAFYVMPTDSVIEVNIIETLIPIRDDNAPLSIYPSSKSRVE